MGEKLEIYGARSIIEAIKANQDIDKVLLLKSSRSSLTKSLIDLIIKNNISHSIVPIQRFDRLKNKNHQGALAFLSPIKLINIEELIDNSLEKNGNPTFILLDGITDVRNFGAIIRTAVATIMHLKASNIEIISLTENAEKSIYERALDKPIAIILGSENKGISNGLLSISDDKIHIPISNKIDSLNVSVAFSVMIFEIIKQKGL